MNFSKGQLASNVPRVMLPFHSSWLACLLLWGCTQKNVVTNWQGGLITSAGEYTSRKDSLQIKVLDAEGILSYAVYDLKGVKLFSSGQNASVYIMWALFLDKDRRIWEATSDVGGLVWIKDKQGLYRSEKMNSELSKRMAIPKQVFFGAEYNDSMHSSD